LCLDHRQLLCLHDASGQHQPDRRVAQCSFVAHGHSRRTRAQRRYEPTCWAATQTSGRPVRRIDERACRRLVARRRWRAVRPGNCRLLARIGPVDNMNLRPTIRDYWSADAVVLPIARIETATSVERPNVTRLVAYAPTVTCRRRRMLTATGRLVPEFVLLKQSWSGKGALWVGSYRRCETGFSPRSFGSLEHLPSVPARTDRRVVDRLLSVKSWASGCVPQLALCAAHPLALQSLFTESAKIDANDLCHA